MSRATVGSLVINILGRTQDFEKSFGQVEKTMNRLSRRAGALGKSLTASVTLPIVGIGVAAGKMAVDFDTAMNRMITLVGLSREEVEALTPVVKSMAKEFGISAVDAADAMQKITSAQLGVATSTDILEMSLKASAVGLGEAVVIADALTSAIAAYGVETLSAANAADILAAAVREGKMDADSLGGVIGSVLPIASAMGVQFNEVGAAFAAMSRTGTDASQAATALRSILMAIQKPSDQARKALEDLEIPVEDLRKNIKEKGLLDTLELMTEKFEGNDDAIASVFGNVKALTGVMDLMGANVEGTREIFANMKDTTGILDQAFDDLKDTVGFQLKQAIVGIKTELMEFGKELLPMLKEMAELLMGVTKFLSGLTEEQRRNIVIAAGVLAAIGPLLLVFSALLKSLAMLATFSKVAFGALAVLGTATGSLILLLTAVGAAAYMFGTHILRLGEVGEAVGQWLFDFWQKIPDMIEAAKDAVARFAIEGLMAMGQMAENVRGAFVGLFEWLTGSFAKVGESVSKLIGVVTFGRFGGGSDIDGARAAGGPVGAGGTYLVGEQGPELFTPTRSGSIISNENMGGLGADGEGAIMQIRDMLMAVFANMEGNT